MTNDIRLFYEEHRCDISNLVGSKLFRGIPRDAIEIAASKLFVEIQNGLAVKDVMLARSIRQRVDYVPEKPKPEVAAKPKNSEVVEAILKALARIELQTKPDYQIKKPEEQKKGVRIEHVMIIWKVLFVALVLTIIFGR